MGANLWLDQLDMAPGERWDQSIQEALEKCETLLVILSPEHGAQRRKALERALTIFEKTFGPDHPHAQTTRSNLAALRPR